MTDRRMSEISRRGGQIVGQFLLVLPLLAMILLLLFYFGRQTVRIEKTSVMSRYETWRQTEGAPGPSADVPAEHPLLDQTFFAEHAGSIALDANDSYFSDEPYDVWLDAAAGWSVDAGDLMDRFVHIPTDGSHRLPRGRRMAFVVAEPEVPGWEQIALPVRRGAARMHNAWRYDNHWRAGPDIWQGGSPLGPQMLYAARDAFWSEFDEQLDEVDGTGPPQYRGSDRPELPSGETLLGVVRRMYLSQPSYHGPIVFGEQRQLEP